MPDRNDTPEVEEPATAQAEERELSAEELDQVSGGWNGPVAYGPSNNDDYEWGT